MKKTTLLAAFGLIVLSLLALGAFAYGQRLGTGIGAEGASGTRGVRGAYHEQMEQIMESGTFADLVALRTETGRQLMPFVTDETTFAAQQERHEQMVEQYGEGPRAGGCPMQQGVGGRAGNGMGKGTGRGTGGGAGLGGCAHVGSTCPFAEVAE